MTETTIGERTVPGDPAAQAPVRRETHLSRGADAVVRGIGPVILGLAAGAVLLLALGRNPITFYVNIYKGGITLGAWQDSVMRMAPLLLIGAGLVVVFRASIWNLGYDGQFNLAAAIIAGVGPSLERHLPNTITLVILFGLAAAVGGLWTIVPAALKAWYETNEIITTLMMSFIGLSLANILIKGPFQDFSSNVPQTSVLPFGAMLPSIPGTRVHVGILVALFVVVVLHYVLTRTAWGLRLQVLGANRRAAVHAGLSVRRLIVSVFLVSGVLVGLAAAAEILGIWGYVRADQPLKYGDAVIPFVFLARLNTIALVPFVAFYSVLSIGGALATREANLPTDFLLVLVGMILLFMAVTEYLGTRRDLGRSYLTAGLAQALRRRQET